MRTGRDERFRPDLVIFDCDGVLVDSEPISIAVLVDFVRDAGFQLSEQDAYDRFLGRSMATVCAMLGRDPGLAVTQEHLEGIRATLQSRFRAELQPMPGIVDTLGRLETPLCVASSSLPERIALSLEVTGLADLIGPHIFSATMVENGKPAPDLFLHAAATLGVSPAHCLVVEDSAPGIEAAKRAGMRVFAFTGGAHAGPISLAERVRHLKPDLLFDDMRELPALLGAAG